MKKLSLKASCLCGSIKLKTQGYHRNIQNCHCVQCTKTHGNYAAYTYVEEKNVKFLKKRNLKWFKSSKGAKRVIFGTLSSLEIKQKDKKATMQNERSKKHAKNEPHTSFLCIIRTPGAAKRGLMSAPTCAVL